MVLSRDNALLIDALQVAPRASWSAIGEVLGISAVTAAKRWQRLADDGLAWVTAGPGMAMSNAQCLAYAEITCHPHTRFQVADTLATHGPAITVELTTGNADLLVTVAAVDLPTMSHYLLEHLANVAGVVRTKVRIVTRLYSEGSSWRLRLLPGAAVAALRNLSRDDDGEGSPPDGSSAMSATAKAILTHLVIDGRASYTELAERSGTSPTTARRRVNELLRSGVIILRTDVSAGDVGWPVETYMWADTPVGTLVNTAQRLSGMRQTRLTVTVAGSESLAYCSWLPTVEEVHRLELAIAEEMPLLRVVDRLIVLRAIKRNGRLLDASGRAIGLVPINIWDDLLCDPVRCPT
jgi:DNA-binding Lrp family transcriptional regulator